MDSSTEQLLAESGFPPFMFILFGLRGYFPLLFIIFKNDTVSEKEVTLVNHNYLSNQTRGKSATFEGKYDIRMI